jgi:predicted enzyme related to lactoylglutathione lyase
MRTNSGGRALLGWPTWIGVVARDLRSQHRFWSELLAAKEVESGPDYVHFEMGPGRSFEVIQRSDEPQYDRARFQVGFAVEDIGHAREALIRRGVKPVTEIIQGSDSAWAYFPDPEGNVFEMKDRQRD